MIIVLFANNTLNERSAPPQYLGREKRLTQDLVANRPLSRGRDVSLGPRPS